MGSHAYADSYSHAQISNYEELLQADLDVLEGKITLESARGMQYKTGDMMYGDGKGHLLHFKNPDKVSKRKALFKKFGANYYDSMGQFLKKV